MVEPYLKYHFFNSFEQIDEKSFKPIFMTNRDMTHFRCDSLPLYDSLSFSMTHSAGIFVGSSRPFNKQYHQRRNKIFSGSSVIPPPFFFPQ